jgi:hypothetical protein
MTAPASSFQQFTESSQGSVPTNRSRAQWSFSNENIATSTRKSSQGSIAVEFAILLVTVLPLLIAAVLFFGRYFWHYSVAEKRRVIQPGFWLQRRLLN